MPSTNLTARDVLGLVFEDVRLCRIPYQSRTVDTDYPVRVVTVEAGRFLIEHDPEEKFLKIFFYPTHAEIWIRWQWEDSNSKYELRKKQQAESQAIDTRRCELRDFMESRAAVIGEYLNAKNYQLTKVTRKKMIDLLNNVKDRDVFYAMQHGSLWEMLVEHDNNYGA